MHRRLIVATLVASLVVAFAACGDRNTASPVPPPGAERTPKTKALDAGAAALQGRAPIDALAAYLNGFHFYNGRTASQMEAHHFCGNLNDDLTQCAIYDGNTADAKLIGVEYIISEKLFDGLPEPEKPLWHSHVYEVKSGALLAPGLPQVAEHALMKRIVRTYGKTWHFWHTDMGKALPLGVPQLMMGFTADGQADAAMIRARDERLGVSSTERRRDRADIEAPPVRPGADAWQHGRVVQLPDPTGTHAPPPAR
jgi:Protein of unknown function (DUF1264)